MFFQAIAWAHWCCLYMGEWDWRWFSWLNRINKQNTRATSIPILWWGLIELTAISLISDMNQLKYSIRSVDLFASWVRDIYIVTNGQVPVWLNTAHPRIKLITHQDIFTNQSHLPTFNSAAIESQLHHITGLSRRFLYFNDDVALLRPICLEDFYTKENGYVLYPKRGKNRSKIWTTDQKWFERSE